MAISPESNAEARFSRSTIHRHLLVAAALVVVAEPADAQSWEVEPFVELIATYTDNLYLGVEGDEVSAWVGQINPGITLRKDRGRVTTNTYYRLQGLFFSDSSDLNTVFHQLDMNGTLEIVSDRFFVDLDASIDQSVVDPRDSIPISNVVATENLGDVSTGNVNPYFVQQLGGNAFLRLDYLWGVGRYDGFSLETFSRVDDYTRDMSRAYLGTGPLEGGLEWSLRYDRQDIDYENVPDFLYEQAQMEIGVPIGRQFRLIGLVGQESDLLISRQLGGLDSDLWEVGFRINSGPRKSFEVRTGERFFGTSYFGNLVFEGQRLNASVTYSENPTTSALGDIGSLIIPLGQGAGSGADSGSAAGDDIIIGPIRAEVYVSKIFRARFELTGGRTVFYVAYFEEDREFLDDPAPLQGSQDGQSSATAGFRYELGPRTDMEISAIHLTYDYTDTVTSTRVIQGNLGFVRQLGRESELRFAYRHVFQETDSASDFNNYTENAIDIALVKRF